MVCIQQQLRATRGRAPDSSGGAAPLKLHAARRALRSRQTQPPCEASFTDGVADARIKVIGCGGGGGNAVNRMITAGLQARVRCSCPTTRRRPVLLSARVHTLLRVPCLRRVWLTRESPRRARPTRLTQPARASRQTNTPSLPTPATTRRPGRRVLGH